MDRERLKDGWRQPKLDPSMIDAEDAAIMGADEALSPQEKQEKAPEGELPERVGMAIRQLDRWIASMERLGLADYVRYVDDRKRVFWSNFWGGVARGVGMAVGFTILGAILVLILQDLAKHNLPVIGDALAQIVSVVQNRLK